MIEQVSPCALPAWLESARRIGEPVVLDVREDLELRAASVGPGAFTLRTIPMGSIPARLSELDPAQPIACLCHHGARSLQVASFLQAKGFSHVVNIAGGIDAWAQEFDSSVARY